MCVRTTWLSSYLRARRAYAPSIPAAARTAHSTHLQLTTSLLQHTYTTNGKSVAGRLCKELPIRRVHAGRREHDHGRACLCPPTLCAAPLLRRQLVPEAADREAHAACREPRRAAPLWCEQLLPGGAGGGAHFARQESRRRLDSRHAAPPTRNRQLGMSMERSLPKYQFCVMFSVETTSARALGYRCAGRQEPRPLTRLQQEDWEARA